MHRLRLELRRIRRRDYFPPPEQELAIYTGWLLNGRRGGVVAGTLFGLPCMLAARNAGLLSRDPLIGRVITDCW